MILVSRERCGCVASALLLPNPTVDEIKEFAWEELIKDMVVSWEDRETVSAEKCLKHELEQIRKRLAEVRQ